MLSALQRLNSGVGYLAAWPDTGPGLAKTRDNGGTWQRLSVPVTYLVALRFIDEQVGWAAGFSTQDYGTACPKPSPSGAPRCQVEVLRTQDGGKTWQRTLLIPADAGAVMDQIQAVDGQRAWVLTADPQPCTTVCQSALRRTVDGGHF